MTKVITRCAWAQADQLIMDYHDHEWGVPKHGEHELFELLTLEGAQAGLSWLTILKRREGYRLAFQNFNPDLVAQFSQSDVDRLLADAGIIRNRAKIASAITNAQAVARLRDKGGFDAFLWQFVHDQPIINHPSADSPVPATTPLAQNLSRDLKHQGFTFVGPTIMYAFMQSSGIVNDHLISCFKHPANVGL